MRYFSTRRTGDIERRLSGAIAVRQFITTGGVQVLTSVAQLIAAVILMFVFNWVVTLVYLATIPLYFILMRYSSTRLRPAYDDLEANYGRYSSGQIDAIRGIETVKALAAEDSLRNAMLTRFQIARQAHVPHPVHRAHLPGAAPARELHLVRGLPVRRLARGDPRAPHARGVRRLQRADRARERTRAAPALDVGPAAAGARPAPAPRRRARAGAGAGPRPLAPRRREDARRPRRAARTSASTTGRPTRRRSSSSSPSPSSRARRSPSSAGAARARRR